MKKEPLLSLCIPTNGIMNLVQPVIESIYHDQVDEELFEVVIMDNGDNKEFFDYAQKVSKKYSNFHYYHTDKKGFLNEFESYKKANGVFIKFINHRTLLKEGTLDYFINFIKNNIDTKPAVYFSNSALGHNRVNEYNTFDEYVKALEVYNTWSTGIAFWKSDFEHIDFDDVNELFPHTKILYSITDKDKYIVDDVKLLEEIHISHANKGKYDVFYAFAVEFNNITNGLLKRGLISKNTFVSVKESLLNFCVGLYYQFVIKHEPCSYIIDKPMKSIRVYYSPLYFHYKVMRERLRRLVKHG